MIDETVPEVLAGERLDRYVSLVLEVSRSSSASLISAGAVEVNGAVETTRSRSLSAGDRVRVVAQPDDDPGPAPDADVDFDVIHADEHLVVVDKPPGLVVHPGAGNPDHTLVNGLLSRFPDISTVGQPQRPGIVHRLDAGTSGLLVVARTGLAYDALVAALAAHRVQRSYLAVVWGTVEADRGIIDAPLGRSPRDPTRRAVVADGRDARTHYEVRRRVVDPAVTVLTCELETGRTHQIRVHLSSIGHPIVGDRTYGGYRESLPFGRPALHAAEIELVHPVTRDRLAFRSEPPTDLADLLRRLGE